MICFIYQSPSWHVLSLISLPHGVPRVDDLPVISGIIHVLKIHALKIHVLKRGLQWRDAPREYGPHKTLYNRFIRWSKMGSKMSVFNKIFIAPSTFDGVPEQLQIDATHLKAHRTAASLLKPVCLKKGCSPMY